MEEEKFIGSLRVESSAPIEGGKVAVHLEGGQESVMTEELFMMITRPDKREGGITDAVRHNLAVEFLDRMADLDLDFYFVEHVATGMQTLIHNLREKAIADAFDCTGGMDIKLNRLVCETE